MVDFSFLVSEIFSNYFAIISFVVSAILASSFFLSNWIKDRHHEKTVKDIIKANISQLTKIYDRLYADVDGFTGTLESDKKLASEISLYFERKHTRIEMIRMNIENQMAHIAKTDSFYKNISKILKDLDIIMETCYDPKLPLKYHLSIWQDNRDLIQSTTENTISVAREKLKIQ